METSLLGPEMLGGFPSSPLAPQQPERSLPGTRTKDSGKAVCGLWSYAERCSGDTTGDTTDVVCGRLWTVLGIIEPRKKNP